jgi:hypothetical protein
MEAAEMTWKTHGKSIISLLATLVIVGYAAVKDVTEGGVTPSEYVTVIIAGFATFVVWATANISGFEKAKTLVAATALVLNLLVTIIVGGISTDEAFFLIVQFIGALGIAAAPATKQVIARTVIER